MRWMVASNCGGATFNRHRLGPFMYMPQNILMYFYVVGPHIGAVMMNAKKAERLEVERLFGTC